MNGKIGLDQVSLIEQLSKILNRLESEFHDLVGDMRALDDPKYAKLEMVAEKIDFAAYCISTARRVLADERVSYFLETSDKTDSFPRR